MQNAYVGSRILLNQRELNNFCQREAVSCLRSQIRVLFDVMQWMSQQQINMLGVLSAFLFLHSMVSTLRWRKFVQASQEPFFLPVDIALEIIIATIAALYSILKLTGRFKALKQFTQPLSYDATFNKPNFKNLRTSRAVLLLPFVRERLDSSDLALDFTL